MFKEARQAGADMKRLAQVAEFCMPILALLGGGMAVWEFSEGLGGTDWQVLLAGLACSALAAALALGSPGRNRILAATVFVWAAWVIVAGLVIGFSSLSYGLLAFVVASSSNTVVFLSAKERAARLIREKLKKE